MFKKLTDHISTSVLGISLAEDDLDFEQPSSTDKIHIENPILSNIPPLEQPDSARQPAKSSADLINELLSSEDYTANLTSITNASEKLQVNEVIVRTSKPKKVTNRPNVSTNNQSLPIKMSFCTTKNDEEILPFNAEAAEKWFAYFEELTNGEIADRKRYLSKVLSVEAELKSVMLENYTKGYDLLKQAVIDFTKTKKKRTIYYPVDHKVPKFRHEEIADGYYRIYSSYKEREQDLPLELLKANLPTKIREFVRNHEAATIERVIDLAEQATEFKPEDSRVIRCFLCNKEGHKKYQCRSRAVPYQRGRGYRGAFQNRGGRSGFNNYNNYQGAQSNDYRGGQNGQFDQHSANNLTTRKRANMVTDEQPEDTVSIPYERFVQLTQGAQP